MKKIMVLVLRSYKYTVGPFLPSSCRYQPSCSSYAIEAIERHGIIKGTYMTLRRLARCHPFHEGGFDPVP